jgi:hypothetical protein
MFLGTPIIMVLAAAISLWCGYRLGRTDERQQWRKLIASGQLPKPGQRWVPADTPLSEVPTDSKSA